MWLRHHQPAQRTGARLVHSCGFDSIPYDLGALFTVEQLPEGVPISSRGSCASAAPSPAAPALGRAHHVPAAPEPSGGRAAPADGGPARRVARVRGNHRRAAPRRRAGGWVVPVPTIDPSTVLRSARALDRYGPDFSYSHYIVVKRLPVAVGLAAGVGAVVALAQLPPTRKAPAGAQGPRRRPHPRAARQGVVQGPLRGEGGGGRVVTEVTRRRPGLRRDVEDAGRVGAVPRPRRAPDRAGQLTPAVAMGQALIDRLVSAGIGFATVSDEAAG